MESPLSPELLAEVSARAKKQIRLRMRRLRGGYPPSALAARSRRIMERLCDLPELRDARGVASFWPMVDRGEVDLRSLHERLRAEGKQLYYPFMDPKPDGGYRTGFRAAERVEDLSDRGRKFFEPPTEAHVAAPGDVEVVIVPALAAAQTGHRIGYGAGYYDATLGDVCPPAVAVVVAYDFQLLAEVPYEPHDRPGHLVVTDSRVLRVGDSP